QEAQNRMDELTARMAKEQGVTEKLKVEDQREQI
ncbi:hypothetical protein, partial [Caproiciproducens sp.]